MYRLQTIIIVSLLPVAILAFVGLMTLSWFQTVLDWVGRLGSAYCWIVFVALIIKGRKRQRRMSDDSAARYGI